MLLTRGEVGADRFDAGDFDQGRAIFLHLCLDRDFEEFLTLPAYERLVASEGLT